jgi:hypothetical protein
VTRLVTDHITLCLLYWSMKIWTLTPYVVWQFEGNSTFLFIITIDLYNKY